MNMAILLYNSDYFNPLDQKLMDKSTKQQDIQSLMCGQCSRKDTCPNPRCVFNGHYPHNIYLYNCETKSFERKTLWIQRIYGKGCRMTATLAPTFHVARHPFVIKDALEIVLYDCSPLFNFNDPSLMASIYKLIIAFNKHSLLSHLDFSKLSLDEAFTCLISLNLPLINTYTPCSVP